MQIIKYVGFNFCYFFSSVQFHKITSPEKRAYIKNIINMPTIMRFEKNLAMAIGYFLGEYSFSFHYNIDFPVMI